MIAKDSQQGASPAEHHSNLKDRNIPQHIDPSRHPSFRHHVRDANRLDQLVSIRPPAASSTAHSPPPAHTPPASPPLTSLHPTHPNSTTSPQTRPFNNQRHLVLLPSRSSVALLRSTDTGGETLKVRMECTVQEREYENRERAQERESEKESRSANW